MAKKSKDKVYADISRSPMADHFYQDRDLPPSDTHKPAGTDDSDAMPCAGKPKAKVTVVAKPSKKEK